MISYPVYRFCPYSRSGDCIGRVHLGVKFGGHLRILPAPLDSLLVPVGFPLCRWGHSRVCVWAACTWNCPSPFPLLQGSSTTRGQFWPWVSISDERFHGKRMTFMSRVDLVISFGDYLLNYLCFPSPHCCWQSRLSCSYYLLKGLKRKRPRLTPNNCKEATCLRPSKCSWMGLASRLEGFISKQSRKTGF